MPTAMRAPFIIRNIWDMPRFSTVPTSSPSQSSLSPKLRTQVAEPLMPILCSMGPTVTSLLPPTFPSAEIFFLGTMNSDRPLVPGGAPSTRARTRCTMFSARSWSPPEMKTLVPLMAYLPFGSRLALVFAAPTSVPACGPVEHPLRVELALLGRAAVDDGLRRAERQAGVHVEGGVRSGEQLLHQHHQRPRRPLAAMLRIHPERLEAVLVELLPGVLEALRRLHLAALDAAPLAVARGVQGPEHLAGR